MPLNQENALLFGNFLFKLYFDAVCSGQPVPGDMEVMKTNKLTDVSTRVTCSRPSRRRELYTAPWDRRR